MSLDARFLTAVADELTRSRELAETLAPLLSERAEPAARDTLLRAQNLDLLVQQLDALAAMTARVAEGDKPQDAVAAAPLGRLVERMRAVLEGWAVTAGPYPPASGDLMLFD